MDQIEIYGIENPLIDIVVNVTDDDLHALQLHKGTMHLIDENRREEILRYIENKEKTYSCGGSCPNTMIALSSFGISTALGGKIGNDEFGRIYQQQLKKHKTVSELRVGEGPTGSSIIMVSPDCERTMNTFLGMCRHFSCADINTDLLSKVNYLYFTGYMWDTECQKEAVLRAIEIAEKNRVKIVFDVADPFAVARNRETFLDIIKNHAYAAFANREEARGLFQSENLETCMETFSSLCEIAVIKNGSEGAYVKNRQGKTEFIPARKVKPVDTTGAGDMFAAGFLYGLCKNMSLRESGIIASYMASQIILQLGAQFTETTLQPVQAALRNNGWNYLD